ncbi:MAG: hypothetical protein WC529_03860 [Candidatus Margulisiibacteriota bacterium]
MDRRKTLVLIVICYLLVCGFTYASGEAAEDNSGLTAREKNLQEYYEKVQAQRELYKAQLEAARNSASN